MEFCYVWSVLMGRLCFVFCVLCLCVGDRTSGDVNYVPITSTSPASSYWGIDQSIAYNNQTILETTAGIVDTGAFPCPTLYPIPSTLHTQCPPLASPLSIAKHPC